MRPTTEAMTVEDVKVKLAGATHFSVMDMNEAYHQLQLDEESRHLTTFYGTTSRMRYKRLNYGTISAQDIFDKAMDDTIHGLQGVLHIRDDFIVHGSSKAEHDDNLRKLLERFKECGLTFSPKKCKFCLPSIEFFGFVFSKEGVSPAPSKVEALRKMEGPSNASEVRSLLGMAQYSAQFIPKFAEITAPLRELTHNDTPWKWGKEEEQAFKMLKDSLSADSVLGYYEVGLETKLMVDAGPKGLGLVLFQKKPNGWQPIACHSKSLTAVEQRYSQLEKEALAVRWGCERCYKYLIGSTFTVLTDHQPLIPLFKNPNNRPPMRLERWLMFLQQFDFGMEYCPGKKNGADYLSRHAVPLSNSDANSSNRREAVVHALVQYAVPKAMSLEEVCEETEKDEELTKLIPLIQHGEMRKVKEDMQLQQYHQVFPELSVAEGVVMRGHQILIPKSLRERVLDICHEAHLGIVKSKQLLRTKVWFPGIDRSMERKVAGCIPCQASVRSKQRNPLQMTVLPQGPWRKVAADFCGPFPNGELLLVVIDEASRYPVVETVKSTSASEVTLVLDKILAAYGIPEHIKSDNGPPFNSQAFKEFCREKGMQHHRVTPVWPEANGLAENFMKNIGKVTKVAHNSGKDWRKEIFTFLSQYRSVPHPSTGKTPNYMIFGRELRNKLPEISEETIEEEIQQRDAEGKRREKQYADEHRKAQYHELRPGDMVVAKQQKRNKLSLPYDPIPYRVETVKGSMITAEKLSDGKHLTRNSSHFKKLQIGPEEVCIEEPVDFPEEGDDQAAPEETAPEMQNVPTPLGSPEARCTRSGREIKTPSWLKDYVQAILVSLATPRAV
jgi:transposase InsO family protein